MTPSKCVLLAALLAVSGGCCSRQEKIPERPLLRKIDQSLSDATHYLVRHQSADGAWRSDVYGNFKEGDALTPLVLHALLHVPESPRRDTALQKGRDYLASPEFIKRLAADEDHRLNYPTYSASLAVLVLSGSKETAHRKARNAWLSFLRRRQLTEEKGWQPDDLAYGSWGLAGEPPHKPSGENVLPPFAQANLSATVFALDGLRAAGCSEADPAFAKALRFVRRCQNNETGAGQRNTDLDDGGFYFSIEDVVRNKAGSVTRENQTRYRSYGSATADGLRGLLICGLTPDDTQVKAAREWLHREFEADNHPGQYTPEQEPLRNAVYYYYCRSTAMTFRMDGVREFKKPTGSVVWAETLATTLLKRQRSDGSWENDANSQRENDPLLATSMAATSLGLCRLSLMGK